jgi:hypothetical protein
MTPQSCFMVAAPIAPGQEAGLRALLATMNTAPGVVDPNNTLVPFARFDRLHVARFVILHDETVDDLRLYGAMFENPPVWLVFLGDCDGPAETMLAEFAALAGAGLAQIFGHCEGFGRDRDLLAWMQGRSTTPATQYVNWVGRTVRQIREEAALHAALRERLQRGAAAFEAQSPLEVRRQLAASARQDGPPLTPPAPTPFPGLRKIAMMIGVSAGAASAAAALRAAHRFFSGDCAAARRRVVIALVRPSMRMPKRAGGPRRHQPVQRVRIVVRPVPLL